MNRTTTAALALLVLTGCGRPDDPEAAAQAHSEVMHMAMNAGIPAEEVAQMVVDGVRQNLMYLFPHPELKASTEARVQTILDAFGEADPERVKAQEEFLASLLQ